MNSKLIVACLTLALAPLGCDDSAEGNDTDAVHDTEEAGDGHESEGDGHDEETELITTVTLTFTAPSGDAVVASFSDPDGDGGASGSADPIVLAADTTYTLTVELLNDLEGEDITEEVQEEAEEHQFLFFGPSVTGPASDGDGLVTHAYADIESDYGANAVGEDLPVGIANTITTSGAATGGEFNVMLRHLPEINGEPQKTSDLAAMFLADGTAAGDVDVNVSFDLTVE